MFSFVVLPLTALRSGPSLLRATHPPGRRLVSLGLQISGRRRPRSAPGSSQNECHGYHWSGYELCSKEFSGRKRFDRTNDSRAPRELTYVIRDIALPDCEQGNQPSPARWSMNTAMVLYSVSGLAKLATILLVSYYSSYIAVTKSIIHYPGTKDL